ncbi:MAG: TetR/AcrR family transcriptional regulator [Hyphomonadaceae bacterium]|nr:TetR/AcrR family transcriptional regulator [Hyphomonadaceae bacterium]
MSNPKKSKTTTKKPGSVKVRVRSAPGKEPTRTDHRSERTVQDILNATFAVLMEKGTDSLSIRAVCDKAGISRGTLYRYFASKEALIEAATLHLRNQTDKRVADAVDHLDDPKKRFEAFLDYTLENIESAESRRLLRTEPAFLLNYFRENFDHFKKRIDRALGPVYDSWDERLDGKLDRDLVSELFVRYALSETLIPTSTNSEDLPQRVRKMLKLLR